MADTVLLEGFGFDPPADMPMCGLVGRPRPEDPDRPTIAVVTYRANVLAGNTLPVEQLCDAIERRGANARPVYAYSLRNDPAAIDLLRGADVVVTTTWAAGGSIPTADEAWSSPLDVLDVPVLQAVASTTDTATWADSPGGLSPLDVALGVAIPEFDGRIIGPPLSFKEVVDDGDQLGVALAAHRAVPDRVERIAGIATRLARLRHLDNADKRVGIVLTAYPTKRSRIGNAVALDTPASLLRVLDALATAGYKVAEVPDDSDAFMARLADGLTYDRPSLSPDQLALAVGRLPVDRVRRVVRHPARRPPTADRGRRGDRRRARSASTGTTSSSPASTWATWWWPSSRPGDSARTPSAPTTPPTSPRPTTTSPSTGGSMPGFGADALVHMGKHGTLEWLPGKGVGPSAACIPDACLGDLPLLYPFVVNDPGEGTQAKRRTHAVIVDHLPPPMTRAETYDELSRVERLLDEHAKIESLDPSKLPAIRGQLWDLLVTSELARDLGVAEMPDPDDFAGMINHVDGYLCSLKDAQIRGGLHVLGAAPAGEALVDTILAITRQPQGPVPSLRATVAAELGLDLDRDVDRLEDECRRRVEAALGGDTAGDPTLGWVWSTLVPALVRTPDELGNLLAGLDGRHVPAGPSGAPTRGARTSFPPGATSIPSTQRRSRRRWRGTSGGPWPTAWSSGTWPRRGPVPGSWAWSCGARPTCAPRATTWPRPWPCSASARCGTPTRDGSRAWR